VIKVEQNKTFPTMLKILRKISNKKIKDIEAELQLGNNVYGNYERGTRLPDILTIKKIAEYYNVSVDFLLGTTDSPEINVIPEQEYTLDMKEAGITFTELIKNKNYKDLSKEELNLFIKVANLLRKREVT